MYNHYEYYYYHPFLSSVSGYIDNRSTRSRQGKGWWNIWNDTRKNQVSMNYVQGRWLQKRIVPTRVYPRKYIITHRETSVSSFSWKMVRINFFNIRAGFKQGCKICVSVSAQGTSTRFTRFYEILRDFCFTWSLHNFKRFFARNKFSAARHLKLFCTPVQEGQIHTSIYQIYDE